jgi:hypothetical protein
MAQATWVTQSKVAFLGGLILKRADLVASEGGAASASLHLGTTEVAPLLVQLQAPAASIGSAVFDPGVKITEGLYVKLGDNAQGVLLIWEELPK